MRCINARLSITSIVDQESRSDRPLYCVTTLTCGVHLPLTLTYDLDFQSQVSYDHDLHVNNNSSAKVSRLEWKQTDMTDCITFPANEAVIN